MSGQHDVLVEIARAGLARHAGEDACDQECGRCFWSDGKNCDDRQRYLEILDLIGEKP